MSALRLLVAALCAILLAVTMVLLGVAITLSSSVLDTDFVVAEVERMPVHTLFAEEAKKQVPPEAEFLLPLVDQAAEDLEPWAKEQAAVIVRAAETFVQGDLSFTAVISLEEPKQYLADHLEEAVLASGLPGFELLNEKQLRSFLAMVVQEIDNRLPDTFRITEEYLEPDMLDGLRTAREYAGWVTWSLRLLPVIAILLVLLIAMVQLFRGRPITRFVGVALLVAGISSIVLWQVAPPLLSGMLPTNIPAAVSAVLPGAVARACESLLVYGVVVLLVGAGLVVLSFKLRAAE